jgi:hypothetical protein
MAGRVVLVPGVLALLPEYAGQVDPVAELRAVCVDAVRWLTGPVAVVADPQGRRVAEHLLAEARGFETLAPQPAGPPSYLVVGNGSACRTEKAPGHLDERAAGFDEALGKALVGVDLAALRGTDQALARELWAATGTFPELAEVLQPGARVRVDYDDAPYGVQYWVIRWELPG